MQQHIHTIVKHFFQKDSLQEVSEQVLQQFTADHPYSTVGHWLLAKKVYDTAPERAAAQSAHAVAWFNNPLWLHWTLQEHEPVAETLLIPAQKAEPVISRPASQPAATTPAPDIVAEPVAAPDNIIETAPAANAPDADTDETEILIPGVSEPVSLIEEVPPAITTAEVPVTNMEAQATGAIEALKVQPVFFVASEVTGGQTGAASHPDAATSPAAESQNADNADDASTTPAVTAPNTPPIPGVSELSEGFKPTITEAEEPVFEPYHTIDYFASLGIKLRDADMKDKLGKQLRSFTDWLRSMKKIPAAGTPDSIIPGDDDTVQQSIQAFAGHSVEGREIVTEAMAEVWLKQGSRQKAIAIYEKLSLQNPAKSPYFAARIEQIKAL